MEPNGPAANTTTIHIGDTNIRLSVKDDFAIVPASLKLPNGAPRFYLSFPKALGQIDQGAKYLVFHEATGGYEPPTRNLLERILRAGDLFIDVGAHWGFFSLQAATHPAGNIAVIAFEPDPTNAGILLRNIADRGVRQTVSVVCAACGDNFDLAPLVTNSSMMHSIHGVGLKLPGFTKGPAHWVSVITLDAALTRFPQTASRRVILKIDAEGFEPKVITGAAALLQSGRVVLVIWEFGQAFSAGAEREAMLGVLGNLSKLGFHHVRTASQDTDAPLIPFSATDPYIGNVFSYHPQLLTDLEKGLFVIKRADSAP
jgi:FkbM family methyltransferase